MHGTAIGHKKSNLYMPAALCLVAVLGTCSCGKDPRTIRITEKNKNTFMDEIKDLKGLTVDEVRLLIAYQAHAGMGRALGGNEPNPVGKTVGELIEDARKQAESEKTEVDKQKRLADEAKAKQEAIAAELRKAVAVAVFEKGFVPANPSASQFDAYITFKCAFENSSSKDIRAFKGVVVFQDLFGSNVYHVNLTISDPINAGAKTTWSGVLKFNQFIEAQQRFRNAELKDLKVMWMPASIIFSDGTRIGDDSTN